MTSPSQKFFKLKQFSIFLAEIPTTLRPKNLKKTLYEIKNPKKSLESLDQLKSEIKFSKKIERKELLIIPRFDVDLNRFVSEIRRLDNLELLHTFKPNIKDIHKKIPNNSEFSHVTRDWPENRYQMLHPEIDNFGNLIFKSESPLVKIDFCSNLLWVNILDNFHHSIELDSEENIYSSTYIFPSKLNKKYFGETDSWDLINVNDDSITKVNPNGEVVFQKSVVQILIDNGYK